MALDFLAQRYIGCLFCYCSMMDVWICQYQFRYG